MEVNVNIRFCYADPYVEDALDGTCSTCTHFVQLLQNNEANRNERVSNTFFNLRLANRIRKPVFSLSLRA